LLSGKNSLLSCCRKSPLELQLSIDSALEQHDKHHFRVVDFVTQRSCFCQNCLRLLSGVLSRRFWSCLCCWSFCSLRASSSLAASTFQLMSCCGSSLRVARSRGTTTWREVYGGYVATSGRPPPRLLLWPRSWSLVSLPLLVTTVAVVVVGAVLFIALPFVVILPYLCVGLSALVLVLRPPSVDGFALFCRCVSNEYVLTVAAQRKGFLAELRARPAAVLAENRG